MLKSLLRRPICKRRRFTLGFIFLSLFACLIYNQSRNAVDFRTEFSFKRTTRDPNPNVEVQRESNVDFMAGVVDQVTTKVRSSCRVPEINPFDGSLKPFVRHPRSATCRRVQPDLAFINVDGMLTLNRSAISEFQSIVSCYYKYFDRGETDQDIVYEKEEPLVGAVKMRRPFVKVYCNAGINATRIYVNIFSYPLSPASSTCNGALRHQPLSANGNDVSVFIFCLESASTSMVYRHLPKTYNYLKETGAIIFRKFLKVGENTLPNLAALFTGLRARREQADMPSELPQLEDGFYDSWPMIWSRFRSDKGYETMYMEDLPEIGTFHNNGGGGFRQKPVDHWYFPYWYAQMKQKQPVTRSSKFCFGNEPTYKIYTDILRRHAEVSRGQRQFLFSIYSDLSHDYSSDLERGDDTWYDFFHKLDSSGGLNRTLVIVMGDHGPRFSSIRRTAVGFAEERLPFLAIRIPPFLYSRFPQLLHTLRSNADDRLVTMFDLHQTLLDVLHEDYGGSSLDSRGVRGRSLFRPLPSDRTCHQSGVPDRYCLCDGYTMISRRHKVAMDAAKMVLAEVNKKVRDFESECVTWSVNKILYFLQVPWPNEVFGETKTYFVAVEAHPSNGMFEGVVVRNTTDDSLSFKPNTLERVNNFGKEGSCLKSFALWKFCSCKKYVIH